MHALDHKLLILGLRLKVSRMWMYTGTAMLTHAQNPLHTLQIVHHHSLECTPTHCNINNKKGSEKNSWMSVAVNITLLGFSPLFMPFSPVSDTQLLSEICKENLTIPHSYNLVLLVGLSQLWDSKIVKLISNVPGNSREFCNCYICIIIVYA